MKHAEPTQRQLRVGEQLRHVISEVLQRGHFRDPDLAQAHKVTVTEVRIGADLKNATAFVSPLAGLDPEPILAALNRAAGYIRSEMGRRLEMKFTPHVKFEADTSLDYADKIETLLKSDRVAKDLD